MLRDLADFPTGLWESPVPVGRREQQAYRPGSRAENLVRGCPARATSVGPVVLRLSGFLAKRQAQKPS